MSIYRPCLSSSSCNHGRSFTSQFLRWRVWTAVHYWRCAHAIDLQSCITTFSFLLSPPSSSSIQTEEIFWLLQNIKLLFTEVSAKVSFLRVVAKSISEEHSLCKIIEGASFLRCLSFELSTLNSIWHFFISIVKLIYCLCMSSWWTFIFTLSYPVWAGEQGLCFHQTRSSFIYLLTCVCCTA